MILNWDKNLFSLIKRRKKRKIIGNDIFSICRLEGKFIILDGLCVSLKSKKHFLLTSSIIIKKMGQVNDNYYINFPIFLSGALNYKIMGLTYGFKVNCSKLINVRLKN